MKCSLCNSKPSLTLSYSTLNNKSELMLMRRTRA